MAARKSPPLNKATPAGKRVDSRLRKEVVIWLTTSGAEGRPHAVPVWFWWDGKSFLIYSLPGQKVRDIEANPWSRSTSTRIQVEATSCGSMALPRG